MTPKAAKPGLTKAEIMDWVADWIARELRIDRQQITADKTFVRYGMDSVHAMMMIGDLEERLARRLSPTLAWDYPNVEALADFLLQDAPAAATKAAAREEDLLARLDELSEEEIDRLLQEQLGAGQ